MISIKEFSMKKSFGPCELCIYERFGDFCMTYNVIIVKWFITRGQKLHEKPFAIK